MWIGLRSLKYRNLQHPVATEVGYTTGVSPVGLLGLVEHLVLTHLDGHVHTSEFLSFLVFEQSRP